MLFDVGEPSLLWALLAPNVGVGCTRSSMGSRSVGCGPAWLLLLVSYLESVPDFPQWRTVT